ncbi:hypothetical protein LINGRAHAP2_LOCUS10299, partial [Linum grandiflorum]
LSVFVELCVKDRRSVGGIPGSFIDQFHLVRGDTEGTSYQTEQMLASKGEVAPPFLMQGSGFCWMTVSYT